METKLLNGLKKKLIDEERTDELVEKLMATLKSSSDVEIKTLVGHRFPDDDVWLCCWIARKFIPQVVNNAQIIFVNAGESLPDAEGDSSVVHFDTGGGKDDQHGKQLKNSSSAHLLTERLGFLEDPGLKPLLELVRMVDNIELLPATSIHFTIEGYPRLPEFKKLDGTIDWQKIQERVFELFEIVYNQETQRVQSRKNLEQYAEWTILPNGIKIASLFWHPELREAAFEERAAVVVWTQSRGKDKFYVGIQRHRKYPFLHLGDVVEMLRFREAKVRGINVEGKNLRYIGRGELVSSWYLHDSLGLILSGSRSWKLEPEEYTKLSPREIAGLVYRALGNIPREVVSRWNNR